MDASEQLAANLAAARAKAKMTQEEVGLRSGVHPTEVSRIERGQRDPRVSTVLKLAKALRLPPAALFEGIG